MTIDRTPPFGWDRCDICGGPLPGGALHVEPHVHEECAAGGRPATMQLSMV